MAVLDLKTGQRKTLIRGGSQAEYVPSGHLLYAAAGTLRAVRFDLERLEVLGDPVPVVEDVWMGGGGAANYAVSRSGTLVYVPASRIQRHRDRSCGSTARGRRRRSRPRRARLRRAATVARRHARRAHAFAIRRHDIWIWDLARETLTRLTFDPAVDTSPVWTSDGQRIVFASSAQRRRPICSSQAADGTGAVERLTTVADSQSAVLHRTGRDRCRRRIVAPKTAGDIVWFPLEKPASRSGSGPASDASLAEPEPLVRTPAMEFHPEVSPDGRYLAYQSNESGRLEIYVRPFPRVNDGRWQVSTGGGTRAAVGARRTGALLRRSGEHAHGGAGADVRGDVRHRKSGQTVRDALTP